MDICKKILLKPKITLNKCNLGIQKKLKREKVQKEKDNFSQKKFLKKYNNETNEQEQNIGLNTKKVF